jgi:CubicO group peptidase (beta-lactamase class C family)
VYAPYTTPVYSNIGYSILGRVIENVSGKSYAQYLEDSILKAANMNRTFVNVAPNSSLGFIPAETNWWGTSIGFEQR